MAYTYDEIFALVQSEEGDELKTKMNQLQKMRYDNRFYGIFKDYKEPDKESEINQRKKLESMSPEKFEENRLMQIGQLYYAYKKWNHTKDKMWITRENTDIDSVRRVTGKAAHQSYNTGILYLDEDTISAVQAFAFFGKSKDEEIMKVTPIQLKNIVDEIIACKDMLGKEIPYDFSKGYLSTQTLLQETDIAKRSIGKQKGYNVFGIDDYKLTAKELLSRNSNLIKKSYMKVKKEVKSFLKKNRSVNKVNETNFIGNQTVEFDKEDR